jgi:prepilin-type N-terminal cleavage/methylation domain-containing protein
MTKRGYTLVEVMLTTGIFSLVMAGSVAVYLACYKTWYSTDVAMQAAHNANMVVQRMVYGPHGSNGLRSAISTNVVTTTGSNNWSVTYCAPDGGRYQFAYVGSKEQVSYTDLTYGASNAQSRLIGSRIVASSITPMASTGLSVIVKAAAFHRLGSATNTLTSYIHYRN